MVLVLAIGDFHVPHRSPGLPQRFKALLSPGKIQFILCTGNLCSSEIEQYLHSLGPEVHIVSGDMDSASYPEKAIVNVGNLSFGICHGHQLFPRGSKSGTEALRSTRYRYNGFGRDREMGVDVLITGNSHQLTLWKAQDGGLLINPGSATGAYTTVDQTLSPPSFVLMDVQGSKIVTYSYVLHEVDGLLIERDNF